MPLPSLLENRLTLPVIAAPMFLLSNPDTVVTQCTAGIIGAFPSLNARSSHILAMWLEEIDRRLHEQESVSGKKPAPHAVNLILHPATASRLSTDLDLCEMHKVPIIITSMSARQDVVDRVHGWGGIVLHDVVNARHARKAVSQGVDGLILVAGGAGGHAGHLNPFALVREVRGFYQGPLALGGAISDGAGILAVQALGADLAYMGTRFIATQESIASDDYKQMLLDASATDVLYTPKFSIAPANFLKASVKGAGYDPETAEALTKETAAARPWSDIWSAGHGVGAISDIPGISQLVARLEKEYLAAWGNMASNHEKWVLPQVQA